MRLDNNIRLQIHLHFHQFVFFYLPQNIAELLSFVNNIRSFYLPEDHVLISLVIFPFTNIPLHLLINILDNQWQLIWKKYLNFQRQFFFVKKFIFDNTFFSFINTFYRQIFGTSLWSPFITIAAEIILNVKMWTYKIPFVYKYVDDAFYAVPQDMIEITLNLFNSFNENI